MNQFGEAPRAPLLTGHRAGQIRHHAVTADGATLLTCGDDGLVIAWEVGRQHPRWVQTCDDERYGGHGFATCVVLDDRHAVLGSSARLRIVRLDDGGTVREHLGAGLLAALPGSRLLCAPPYGGVHPCVIVDAWTLVILTPIGTKDSPPTATICGDLILLTGAGVHGRKSQGCEAWHGAGPAVGTLAWRRDGKVRCEPCRCADGTIAICFQPVIESVDSADGRALHAWMAPPAKSASELYVTDGQLLFSNGMGSSPVEPAIGIADPSYQKFEDRRAQIPVDCWHARMPMPSQLTDDRALPIGAGAVPD